MGRVPVLELDNLLVSYRTEKGLLDPVRRVSLRVQPNEKYGLVGESGSGKTTLALSVMRYLPANGLVRGGRILLNGEDLVTRSEAEMRDVWGGKIGMVYQNPSTALNPAIPIGEQIAEVARVHLRMSRDEARRKATEMLGRVRMPDPAAVAGRYPHQVSGGMLQRALIAMALTSNPQLLIMDEPTTALDVTTEAVVLDLIQQLSQEYSSAILYITHNLGVVARLCDRVGVMYAGELMEEARVADLFRRPLHPYTQGLIGCAPRLDTHKHRGGLNTIPGYIPRLDQLPEGCIFAPRCPLAQDGCRRERPQLVEAEPGRFSSCLRWRELAAGQGLVPRRPSETSKPASSTRGSGFDRSSLADMGSAAPTGPTGGGQVPALRSAPSTQNPGPSTRPLLSATGIEKHFKGSSWLSLPGMASPTVKAVDGISLQLPLGLTVGLVGESGCGKTTFGRCLVGLVEPSAGKVELGGERLAPSVARRPRSILKRIQMVFQNPDASLNPRMTVGEIIARPLAKLAGVPSGRIGERTAELLRAVHLPESYASRLPEELSGGEKQRVAIARAFAADPELVICDEPVSALDVSVQGALLNLLSELQRSKGTTYLFISHDLAAVRHLADLIGVVYLGRLWEVGNSEEVFAPPYHPYTEALLSAIPVPDPEVRQKRIRLEGSVPSAIDVPPGCRFHTRCPRKLGPICETHEPPWREVSPTHRLCCHMEIDELRRLQTPVLDHDDRGRAES
ncbi:MAG: dipeptide ABC transporter ATP-binding protein [Sphingomonadaceae bacterium]